jgi:shikimate 5-dehydrogenase
MRRETRRPPEIRLLRGLIAFKHRFGDLPPGVVALAGSGGASKAIAFALAAMGATSLRLFDIDAQKAHALASLQFYLNAPERHFRTSDW